MTLAPLLRPPPVRWFPIRRRRPIITGALLGVALLLAAGVGPAQAHDVLIATVPVDGAVLAAAPVQVKLTFAEQALSIGTAMRVTGPGGAVVSTAPLQVVGPYVIQPLDSGLVPGGYRVLWRVTSADGHPVSGRLTFTVAGAPATVKPSLGAGGASTAPPPAATSDSTTGATPAIGASPPDAAAKTPQSSDPGSTARLAVLAAGVLGVVALAAIALTLGTRRRRRSAPPPP